MGTYETKVRKYVVTDRFGPKNVAVAGFSRFFRVSTNQNFSDPSSASRTKKLLRQGPLRRGPVLWGPVILNFTRCVTRDFSMPIVVR